MKSNRVHNGPPIVEDLGDGRSYYNFDVIQSTKQDDGSDPYENFYYEQVTIQNPATYAKMLQALTDEGYYVTGQKTRLKNQLVTHCNELSIPIE